MKSKYYKDFTKQEIETGYKYMVNEILVSNKDNDTFNRLWILFDEVWKSFKNNEWNYDGATFVKERGNTLFETASFIHDWRNCNGFVGRHIDLEMITVMIHLGYNPELILERAKKMYFTNLNVYRHKLLGTYKKELPSNLFTK